MSMLRTIRVALIVLIVPLGVKAQPLTLAMAEREALEHNLVLRAQRYDILAADADITTADLPTQNPQLTVNADILPTGGAFAPDQKFYGASIAFPFELGGKRDARVAVAQQAKSATSESVNDATRQLLLVVRTSFTDALAAKAALHLAEENLASLDSVVALNRIRVQAHDVAETELLRSEVASEQTRSDLASARIEYDNALTALQTVMGRTAFVSGMDIDGDLTALPSAPVGTLQEAKAFAREHRSDLLALRNTLAAQEANRRLQEANAAIDLSVSADYSHQGSDTYYGSTLSLPLPLYNRNQGERAKAEVRVAQTEQQVRALEQQIDADTETAFREFAARRDIVDRQRAEILPRVQSVRSTVEYAYKTGGTTILDFLDAQRTYNDVMRAHFASLDALHRSAYALQAAIGIQ